MIQRKGYDLLFKSLASLPGSECPPWVLTCYGSGSTQSFQELADSLGIGKRVSFSTFLGVNELIQAYQAADLFVLATRSDTYGIVVHEAAACGLPLIVSRYAGASEVLVEEGVNGYVIDPDNTQEFAAKILRLLKDPQLRRSYGARSRQLAEHWDVKRNAERTYDWLTQLVAPPEERRHTWKTP
jgi:glycosyltransferase involved in cell wall biosynthesis